MNSKFNIIISIALKNSASTIRRNLLSIVNQKGVKSNLFVLIIDDNSTDTWEDQIRDIQISNLIIEKVNFGKVYKVRNYILEYIQNNFPTPSYIIRLDADDYFADNYVISNIEKIIIENNFPDIIIAGNKLSIDNNIIDKINYADNYLLEEDSLLKRLEEMSKGTAENELPSCNVIINSTINERYPNVKSAEDHWFLVKILMKKNQYKIILAKNILLTVYSLSGKQTYNNIKRSIYFKYRKDLYNLFRRYYNALNILKKISEKKEYYFFNYGNEGIVFHDNNKVYKVFIPTNNEKYIEDYKFYILNSIIDKFKNRKHLIRLEKLIKIENIYILIYPYYKFSIVDNINEDEAISFLVESWQERVIFRDIKLSNFIRVNNELKYIDYGFNDLYPYTDNLFLNMAARVFIDLKYGKIEKNFLIKRSSINNFNIPELKGFHSFLNRTFVNIIYEQSKFYFIKNEVKKYYVIHTTQELLDLIVKNIEKLEEITFTNYSEINFEKLFWLLLSNNIRLKEVIPLDYKILELYFSPRFYKIKFKRLQKIDEKISLLIKTCPQEYETIYEQVKHIIKQLYSPHYFFEKVIVIDKKESNYLRQYSDGSLKKLYVQINKLIKENIIDYYIELPSTRQEISEINNRWFGVYTHHTHSIKNIPVTPQIYAFEKVKGDYILQMDSDVLIGREDYDHSFIIDMLKALKENYNAVSVGFNIFKNKEINFVSYHAPKGGYVPEVRFALIDKKRLLSLLPLPNNIVNGKLKLTWYRSLELYQKQSEIISLRGGDRRSFYIHPQNYRKRCKYVWFTILDRIERNIIPDLQRENFDLMGSYYDWAIPKRNEKIVIVTLLRNVSYQRFYRTFYSVISQGYKDFGWIIIDDASNNGIDIIIENLIIFHSLQKKVTFIKNRFREGNAANTYKAIHYFMDNPDSIVVILDGDDAFIGNDVLENLLKKYETNNADVVLGKMYRTDKLYAHYPYMPNLTNPRLNGGNVWQHLRSFKKYLYDSIKLPDLKHTKDNVNSINRNLEAKWFEYCVDYSYMVPIVEMAENPVIYEKYNYLHERTTPSNYRIKLKKEKIIAEILNKPKYSKKDVIIDRIHFKTSLKKIEIDITYDCNLKCIACNRSCTQAPSKVDYMTVDQIYNFIKESIQLNWRWKLINILGGEPTLHPYFSKIINLLLEEYVYKFSPETIIQITSNGYSKFSVERLNEFKKKKNVFIDTKSFKTDKKNEYFTPFNIAPIDILEYKDSDFSKGCWVTSFCGIGLNKFGYYPCGVAGGIDRVLGLNKGIKSLKDISLNKMEELKRIFCKYCGNFIEYASNKGNFIPRCEKAPLTNRNIISKTWKIIYKNYFLNKPKLTPIYETRK